MAELSGLHILIVPAWWPSAEVPISGIFHTDYARAFASAGAQVGVVVPDLVSVRHLGRGTKIPLWPKLIHEDMEGIPIVRIRGLHTAARMPWVQMVRFRRWLRRGLSAYVERHGRPDVLHAMCAIPSAWACTTLNDPLARRVVVTENTGPFSSLITRWTGLSFALTGLDKAAAVVAVSDPLKEAILAAGIERSIQVVPNTTGAEFVGCAPPKVNTNEDGLPIYRGLFVGRLTNLKGIPELIEAALILADDARWVIEWDIAGDGPLAGVLQSRLAGAGSGCRLMMHGLCEKGKVAELLRQSQFLILPSHGENCPLAICEALSIGRPVVTTEADGCRALVGPDEGVLSRIGDAEGLAGAVAELLSDYAKWDWRSISERARKRFSSAAVAAAYGDIFREVIREE